MNDENESSQEPSENNPAEPIIFDWRSVDPNGEWRPPPQPVYGMDVSLRDRMSRGHRIFLEIVSAYNDDDWRTWEENFDQNDDPTPFHVPAYSGPFDDYLAYRLCLDKPQEVELRLDEMFPDADHIACGYLEDVLAEVELLGFGEDKIHQLDSVPEIEVQGGRRFTINLAKARQWLAKRRGELMTYTQDSAAIQAQPDKPTLEWGGTVSSLVVLVHMLERRGLIDLDDYLKKGGSWADLARKLQSVFRTSKGAISATSLASRLGHLGKYKGRGALNPQLRFDLEVSSTDPVLTLPNWEDQKA